MSIADRFDPMPDAGFVRFYDPRTARRQFQVSLALVVILAIAAVALGFLLQFDEPTQRVDPRPSAHEVHFAMARAIDEREFCNRRARLG
jgi:hypothetical protein